LFYGAFVSFAVLTLSPQPRTASPAPVGIHQRAGGPRPPRSYATEADQLYSLRARRRFAAYLRLRLLELREAGLERAAAVIERKLPIDVLVPKR
jgi:hypothetical protein